MMTYYGSNISENMTDTPEGYLLCRNVPIARTGEQVYLARELGLRDGDQERSISVRREEEDVFDPVAMASFEGKDVTDEHPPTAVTPENHAVYSKGHLQNVRREGDYLVADLFIKDPILISEVKNGVKREVSCGYDCEYVLTGDGYKQTHIRGNHVAVVPRGRAGHEVAIQDSAGTARKGALSMSARKALLDFFGMAAKEASPEELKALTENMATVLDAEPAQKAPEAEPTKAEKQEDADIPKGDDLGSKLDKILERLETLEKRVNGHGGPARDEEPAGEAVIDAELAKLAGKDQEKPASQVLEEEDACKDGEGLSKDAATALLRAMRPVVAGIADETAKKSVTDALLDMVRGKDPVPGIQQAAAGAARKAADAAGKTTYQQACERSQAAYDRRNPHSGKKEG